MALKDAVRKVYLYLFALVGLALLIIGSVSFLNMGLKAFIFTKADEQLRLDYSRPVEKPYFIDEAEIKKEGEVTLTLSQSEKDQLNYIFEESNRWQERQDALDIVVVNRQRTAAMNLAMILIGLPLYLYHWLIIRRETKE